MLRGRVREVARGFRSIIMQVRLEVVKVEMKKVLHEFVVVFVYHLYIVGEIVMDCWLSGYLQARPSASRSPLRQRLWSSLFSGWLPCGLRSVPKIFYTVVDALEWCIAKLGVTHISHNLDHLVAVRHM